MPHNFQQISTGRFLARFDNLQPAPPEADHLTHVAALFDSTAGTPVALPPRAIADGACGDTSNTLAT